MKKKTTKKESAPTKADIINDIKEGLKEIKLHQQGKIKLKTAAQLLKEL